MKSLLSGVVRSIQGLLIPLALKTVRRWPRVTGKGIFSLPFSGFRMHPGRSDWCLIPLLMPAVLALAQEHSISMAQWRDDLEFFAAGMGASGHTIDFQRGISTRGQQDFQKLYPKSSFRPALEALKSDTASLPDSEIVLGLMRLVASANVGHNEVELPVRMGFASRLPLTIHWFSDGLAVTGATAAYAAALATHVVRIGKMTPEELLAGLSSYISHENEFWLKEQAPEYIRTEVVLRHFGLIGSDGRVVLTLQKAGEPPFPLSVAFAGLFAARVPFSEALHIPTPLFRSQPGKYYWHRYLEESKTLFIQYNICQNQPGHPFSEFARNALAEADAHSVERVVIDLRQNGGGDSRVINPLRNGLASRLKSIGPVYVLIGPGTFSSGLDHAIELRNVLHAKTVGEPTGGRPSCYGEVKLLTLPNSKLTVRYTTKYQPADGGSQEYSGSTLMPDIPVLRTLADALAGRDPVLEAAVATPLRDRK